MFVIKCDFCNLKKHLENGCDIIRGIQYQDGELAPCIYIDKTSWGGYFINADCQDDNTCIPIKYCPMCGRKLK